MKFNTKKDCIAHASFSISFIFLLPLGYVNKEMVDDDGLKREPTINTKISQGKLCLKVHIQTGRDSSLRREFSIFNDI
jgi:hypothetical protein